MRPFTRWILALVLLLPASVPAAVSLDEQGWAAPRPHDPPVPYVVVTDQRLLGPFMRLAQVRSHGGLQAAVVTLQTIENRYPGGADLAERIRLFLRDARADWGTRWVLLGGDASVVPVRRARLRLGGILGDVDLQTDQYYACLDGSWNADGDGLWGENPGPGESGDGVDYFPELFVGRAPVRTAAEAVAFVQRTLDYEARLGAAGGRSALLAAEVFGAAVDGAPFTEALRPALEADPGRSIVRLYENSAAWPGSLPESRPALVAALDGGFDLAVLVGAGARGVILAGQDPADRVTSQDLLGLANDPVYPIVYALSAWTTDLGDPLSIGVALMRTRRGGAAAVLGTTHVQFVVVGTDFMEQFFAAALTPGTPIGEALAGTIGALHAWDHGDGYRLTTQGMLLLGDPLLPIDAAGAPIVAGARRPGRGNSRVSGGRSVAALARLEGATLAIDGTGGGRTRAVPRLATVRGEGAVLDPPSPSPARSATTVRLALPGSAAGAPYALEVFDPAGRRVRALASGAVAPGRFEFRWDLHSEDGERVPHGVYFVRLDVGATSLVRRVLVVK